jgi:PAS domain S-box-containing protein
LSAPTILTVEDNPITRKMLRLTLESAGYRVEEAADRRSALAAVAACQPALVVLDYVLPDCDGLRLLDEIRCQIADPEVPALVVTGMSARLDELRATSGPFTQCVSKPIEPSRLLEIVRAHLLPRSTRGQGKRVLVVDDEALNLKLATVLLHHEGFEVVTAQGAQEGLAKARGELPDAILSDVLMPSMDGFAFCSEVRRDPLLAGIPVVLISAAYSDAADRELARQMGASALVERNSNLSEAAAALRDSLRDGGRAPSAAGRVPADGEALLYLHRQRLQAQVERQAAQNRTLLRQAGIQATALAVMKSLSDVLSQPLNLPRVISDLLLQCLDAAGLSTGLLYLVEPGERFRLHAQSGLPHEARLGAQSCFGHPGLLRRIVESGGPLPFALNGTPGAADSEQFLHGLGRSAAVGVPFQVLGAAYGVLVLASDTQNLSESLWVGFASSLAAQFGQTVALAQSLTRLAASEARYRALMEQANDAILILDPAQRILEVNRAAIRLLGRPRDELAGRYYEELLVPEERPDSARLHEVLLSQGTLRVPLRHLAAASGARVPVEVAGSLVQIDDEATVVAILHDLTERQRAEEELRQRSERIRLLLDSTAEAIYGIGPDLTCTFCNRACAQLLGHDSAAALVGRDMHELVHHRHADGSPYPAAECPIHLALRSGTPVHVADEVFWRADGTSFPVEYWSYPIRQEGEVVGAVVTFLDISERIAAASSLARLEAHFRQAQRMESVGRLAGGVAHDFNNLLTLILGYGDLLRRSLAAHPELARQVELIMQAGHSAAALTRQLLAFSRRQVLLTKVLDLNALVGRLAPMLKRVIGEDIELAVDLATDLGPIRADAAQMEQVIMNLVVNARDAMPEGGGITISTASELASAAPVKGAAAELRRHVVLTVMDTGIGMDDEVLAHVFEPFFTTKEEGKGTGLGLATVYGIVHQTGGRVEVESRPGAGSCFSIYLPAVAEPLGNGDDDQSRPRRGDETILLVEDQPEIRALAREILRQYGYHVIDAGGGDEALRLSDQHAGPIHLLLTDVIMPGLGGVAVAEALTVRRPGLRVMFMSGYTDQAVKPEALRSGVIFLHKPFYPEVLARKVRECLDQR